MLEYLLDAKQLHQNFEYAFNAVIDYAGAMQTFLDYKTDHLATSQWYLLDVENGTLSDGFTHEYLIEGDEVTVTPNVIEYKIFNHWINKKTGDVLSEEASYTFTQGTEQITLSAVYEDKTVYTIAFNSNGGSEVASIIQKYDTPVTKPANPTLEGKTFLGWFIDEELTTEYTFSTMPKDDITLYAKWCDYEIELNHEIIEAISITTDYLSTLTYKATAIDTDGISRDIQVELISGLFEEGNTISILLKTTGLYNTIVTKQINDIKVYGTPSLEVLRDVEYIDENVDLNSLFTIKDSFGQKLTLRAELINGSLTEPGFIKYRITGQDCVLNSCEQEFDFAYLYNNSSLLKLYENNVLIDRLIVSNNQSFTLPKKYNIPIAWYLGEDIITNTSGNSLNSWNKDKGVYRVDITYYTITYDKNNENVDIPTSQIVCYGATYVSPQPNTYDKVYYYLHNDIPFTDETYTLKEDATFKLHIVNYADFHCINMGGYLDLNQYDGTNPILIIPDKAYVYDAPKTPENLLPIKTIEAGISGSVTYLYFPSSVKNIISIETFIHEENKVEKIVFGKNSSITSLPDCLFQNYNHLKSINLEPLTNLKSIGANIFENCTSLETIVFGKNSKLTSIPSSAFKECTNLKNIDFENLVNLREICDYAFANCRSITSLDLTLMPNLLDIQSFAFSGCRRLYTVKFDELPSLGCNDDYIIDVFYDTTVIEIITTQANVDNS